LIALKLMDHRKNEIRISTKSAGRRYPTPRPVLFACRIEAARIRPADEQGARANNHYQRPAEAGISCESARTVRRLASAGFHLGFIPNLEVKTGERRFGLSLTSGRPPNCVEPRWAAAGRRRSYGHTYYWDTVTEKDLAPTEGHSSWVKEVALFAGRGTNQPYPDSATQWTVESRWPRLQRRGRW